MKKRYFYMLIILSIIFLFIGLFFYIQDKEETFELNDKSIRNYIDELNEMIFKGLSKQELFDRYDIKNLDELFILTGPDMFIEKYDPDLIKKYNLDSYLSKQKKYAHRVEDMIKKEFEVSYDDIEIGDDDGNKNYSVNISYKVYNYVAYLNDLDELTYKIILMKYPNDTGDNENYVDFYYKAKVKAMSILDENLDYYKDAEKRKTVFAYFENRENDNIDYINSYIINLNGTTSSFFNEKSDYTVNHDSRMDGYLNKVDKKHPVKI